MKPVLFAILGLVIGLGGGAAMAVMKAKKSFADYDARRAKVVADSIELAAHPPAATDSAQVAAAGDSAHAAGAPAAGGEGHAPETAAAASTPAPKATPTPAGESHDPPATRNRAVATVESHGGTRPSGKPVLPKPIVPIPSAAPGADKVGRIFGAMQPKEAAKVLEQLTDGEVHEILGSLNEKQAAAILQAMPAPRAAAISKLALKGGHE